MGAAQASPQANGTVERQLDPFAYYPGVKSRIEGLAGAIPGADPHYVFHTAYVGVEPGERRFTLQFDNLQASSGTLLLRIHMRSTEPGARAQLNNSLRIPLPLLAQQGGAIDLPFHGYEGMTVSLLGLIADLTDASAAGLGVRLDGGMPAETAEHRAQRVQSDRATPALRTSTAISSRAPAQLRNPVSQGWTEAQEAEPAYLDWATRLADPSSDRVARWQDIFLLQLLTTYDLMRPGVRLLAMGEARPALFRLLAAAGIELTIATPTDLPWMPMVEPFAPSGGGKAPEAPTAADFDVIWSCGIVPGFGSAWDAFRWLTQLCRTVAPGTMLASTLRLTDADRSEPLAICFNTLQQWVIGLIGRGHAVAQLKVPDQTASAALPNGEPLPFILVACAGEAIG